MTNLYRIEHGTGRDTRTCAGLANNTYVLAWNIRKRYHTWYSISSIAHSGLSPKFRIVSFENASDADEYVKNNLNNYSYVGYIWYSYTLTPPVIWSKGRWLKNKSAN